MSIIRSPYSGGKIALLRQMLENNAVAGTPTDYEIRVDSMKVIQRTNNPELFDNHEDFVNQDTSEIMVILYDGNSRRSTRHIMSMKEEPKKEAPPPAPIIQSLSGVEIERMMEDKLRAQREAWEHNLLKKENKELKESLEEAENESDKLVEAIEKAKENGNKIMGIHWGDIAGVAFEGILKRNVHLLAKIPAAGALAGIIAEDNRAQLEAAKEDEPMAVTFKQKSPEPEDKEKEEPEEMSYKKKSQEECDRDGFLRELYNHFGTGERVKSVLGLFNELLDKPQAIEPFLCVAGRRNQRRNNPKRNS
jgi:hypothetical protein